MSLINVPHPFSIVLKRFYCSQEVLSKIPKPIENNRKWVWWVYNRSEMVYLFGCTIVHHIHFCKHIWSHRLFHWNKYLHFYKDELHKAILLRTRHTYKHSSHTSLKKNNKQLQVLLFSEQSEPLKPSAHSHLKHFSPSSEQLPPCWHGSLSQGRTGIENEI